MPPTGSTPRQKPGEAKLFEKDNTFYVLQLTSINDNNYQTVNALQLYIAKERRR